MAIALGLIVAFVCVEVVVGILASSLALLSDAGHMLTDAAALALSIVAVRLAQRPAKGAMTFGLKRVEILSAQFNGATLLVLALLIIYEGTRRLVSLPNASGSAVLIVALIGSAVNLAASWTLSKANRKSMNVEGAFQHILTEVHDLHVWEVTSGFPALSAHVLVGTENDCHAARRALEAMLTDRFGLEHTTLQVDHEGGELLEIETPEPHQRPVHPH